MSKLVITEVTANPSTGITNIEGRTEQYATFQLAAAQYDLALDYWANRGSVRKTGQKKFTCTITPEQFWVTIELVKTA